MMILYTEKEGGDWIPWNTPLPLEEIRHFIHECGWIEIEIDKCTWEQRFTWANPRDDSLPRFHSILLPTAARWDAYNQEWKFYLCSENFQRIFANYCRDYPNEERRRQFFWRDQGPPLMSFEEVFTLRERHV